MEFAGSRVVGPPLAGGPFSSTKPPARGGFLSNSACLASREGDAIVFNTSALAARVSLALQRHRDRRLIAVDSLHARGSFGIDAPVFPRQTFPDDVTRRLGEPMAETRTDVELRRVAGSSARRFAGIARNDGGAMIVVDAESRRRRTVLRSFAARLALCTPVPVLAVREADSIERWLERKSVLRVMVAIDRSPAARIALEWASGIAGDLPIEVVAAGLDPAVKPADWEAGEAVLEIATKWQADLLVVGMRCPNPRAHWWTRSPAERLIDEAPMNVAAVPCGLSG